MIHNDRQQEDIHMKQLDVDVNPRVNMLIHTLTLTQVTFDIDLTQVILEIWLFSRILFQLTPMANYKTIHLPFQMGE